jgi:hypothetical protein
MKKKYTITFHEVQTPITEPVTKFGGQPVWITEAQWPLSRRLGIPMQFICQIKLYPELFGPLEAQMAYIFMTDHIDIDPYWTSEPDEGENAVILQPGAWSGPTLPLTEGPSLYRWIPNTARWWRIKRLQKRIPRSSWYWSHIKLPRECAVELHPGEDPELTQMIKQPGPSDGSSL